MATDWSANLRDHGYFPIIGSKRDTDPCGLLMFYVTKKKIPYEKIGLQEEHWSEGLFYNQSVKRVELSNTQLIERTLGIIRARHFLQSLWKAFL